MKIFAWWMLTVAVLIGHFGLNLAIYNRLNGLGLPRKTIKRWVKLFFAFTVQLLPLVVYLEWDMVKDVLTGRPNAVAIPIPLQVYSWLCLSSWLWLGFPWLIWRPSLGVLDAMSRWSRSRWIKRWISVWRAPKNRRT